MKHQKKSNPTIKKAPFKKPSLLKPVLFLRKYKLYLFMSILFISYLIFHLSQTTANVIKIPAYVTEVTDGDTITIAGGARIRILGINAPEKGEQGYKEPKKALAALILNKDIITEKDGSDKDRYGRLLRHIWINNTLVSETLAREGLVRAKYFNPQQNYKERIGKAEEEARNQKKGLWKTN